MKLLQQAEQCFWHGQFPEALALLDPLENDKNVPEPKRLQGQLLQCRIYALIDMKKAQEIADQITQSSHTLDSPILLVDTYLVMAEAWLELGKLDTSKQLVEQGKTHLGQSQIFPQVSKKNAT